MSPDYSKESSGVFYFMYGYVYKTTNLNNGRIYVGQKKGVFNPSYFGSGLNIRRALKKHGDESFKVETICYLTTKQELDEFEKFLIDKYREILGRRNLYNIAKGGMGGHFYDTPPRLGKKNSLECREKLRIANLGKKTPSVGLKLSLRQKGKNNFWYGKVPPSLELAKKKCKEMYPNGTNFGNKHSPESINKMKEKALEVWKIRKINASKNS